MNVRLALVLVLEILVRNVGVAKRGVVVLVHMAGAEVLEPAGVLVVIVRDMEVRMRVEDLLVGVLLPALARCIPVLCHIASRPAG